MSIFEVIDSIAFSKKVGAAENLETSNNWQPYMVNRWLSMMDASAAIIVNETVNKYHQVFSNKQDYHKFMINVLPKYRKHKINYIKKPQVD